MVHLTELDELQEIGKAEAGATSGDPHEWIRQIQAGQGERQRPDVRVLLVSKKEDAPVTPGIPDMQDLEALSAQRMKGMGYFEELWSIRPTWCC